MMREPFYQHYAFRVHCDDRPIGELLVEVAAAIEKMRQLNPELISVEVSGEILEEDE